MRPKEMEFHRKLYFGLARCIASVDPEYQAALCRDFRINPKDVADARRPQVCDTNDAALPQAQCNKP